MTSSKIFDAECLNIADTVIEKHSVTIAGHSTSISLERGFWRHLKQLAAANHVSLAALITALDEARTGSLSGALRCYVLQSLERSADKRPPSA